VLPGFIRTEREVRELWRKREHNEHLTTQLAKEIVYDALDERRR
jgi:hypothetical protein